MRPASNSRSARCCAAGCNWRGRAQDVEYSSTLVAGAADFVGADLAASPKASAPESRTAGHRALPAVVGAGTAARVGMVGSPAVAGALAAAGRVDRMAGGDGVPVARRHGAA